MMLVSESVKSELRPRMVFTVPAWLKILAVALVLCQALACIAGRGPALTGQVDFRAFYASGNILSTGHAAQLYNYDYQTEVQQRVVGPRKGCLPFLYPPFAAIPFVLFSMLSYREAFLTFAIANVVLLLASIRLLKRNLTGLHTLHPGSATVLTICFFPLSIALMQGQISLLLLFILSFAWVSLRHRRRFVAGLVLSLLLIKFQLALPIIFLFFCWKQWKVCAGFVVGLVNLASLSWLVVGSSGIASYLRSMINLTSMTVASAGAAKAKYGMYPTDMPNLHGLLFALSRGSTASVPLCVVISLIVVGFTVSRLPSLRTALLAAMLVSYHMQPHDLILLILPLSVLADRAVRSGNKEVSFLRGKSWPLSIWIPLSLFFTFPVFPLLMMSGKTYLSSLFIVYLLLRTARKKRKCQDSELLPLWLPVLFPSRARS